MKAYLSIDLDYWRKHTNPRSCTDFFHEVWKLKLPVYTCLYHHHLLPHVNAQDCDTIINVDYHSDLADLEPNDILDFNEGTWGNFLDARAQGTFVWRYPNPACLKIGEGYCHSTRNPFADASVAQWFLTRKRLGLWGLPWAKITAVGVTLSPDWLGNLQVIQEPLKVLKLERWLTDHYHRENHGLRGAKRQPKFVHPHPKA